MRGSKGGGVGAGVGSGLDKTSSGGAGRGGELKFGVVSRCAGSVRLRESVRQSPFIDVADLNDAVLLLHLLVLEMDAVGGGLIDGDGTG